MFCEKQDKPRDGVRGGDKGGGKEAEAQQKSLHNSLSYWMKIFKMWQKTFVNVSAMKFDGETCNFTA